MLVVLAFNVRVCVVEQESGLKVNQPASFAVSLNGAKGVIDAKVHSPSGALEECCVTEIDQGNHGRRPRLRLQGLYFYICILGRCDVNVNVCKIVETSVSCS